MDGIEQKKHDEEEKKKKEEEARKTEEKKKSSSNSGPSIFDRLYSEAEKVEKVLSFGLAVLMCVFVSQKKHEEEEKKRKDEEEMRLNEEKKKAANAAGSSSIFDRLYAEAEKAKLFVVLFLSSHFVFWLVRKSTTKRRKDEKKKKSKNERRKRPTPKRTVPVCSTACTKRLSKSKTKRNECLFLEGFTKQKQTFFFTVVTTLHSQAPALHR